MRPDDLPRERKQDRPGQPAAWEPPYGPAPHYPPKRRGWWQRLPARLRRALLWLLWAFGLLALVDMALSVRQPGRPLVVATALLEALVRLGAGSLLGGF